MESQKSPSKSTSIHQFQLPKTRAARVRKSKVGNKKRVPQNQNKVPDLKDCNDEPNVYSLRNYVKKDTQNNNCINFEEQKTLKEIPKLKICNDITEEKGKDQGSLPTEIKNRAKSSDSHLPNRDALIKLVPPLHCLSQPSPIDQTNHQEKYSLNRGKKSYSISTKIDNDEANVTVYDVDNIVRDCQESLLFQSPYKSVKKSRNTIVLSNVNNKGSIIKPPKRLQNIQKKLQKNNQEKGLNSVSKLTDIKPMLLENVNEFDVLKVSETFNVQSVNTKRKTMNRKTDIYDKLPSTLKVLIAKSELSVSKSGTESKKQSETIPEKKNDLTTNENLSCSNEKTIISTNLQSPSSSTYFQNPLSLPSSIVNLIDDSETVLKYPVNISKDWLLERFFRDLEECIKNETTKKEIRQGSLIPINNKTSCQSISSTDSANKVIRHASNHIQNITTYREPQLDLTNSTIIAKPEDFKWNRELSEINSNISFIIKTESDLQVQSDFPKNNTNENKHSSKLNEMIENFTIESLGCRSLTLPSINLTTIETPKGGKISREVKRKLFEDNAQRELKILKPNIPSEENFNEVIDNPKGIIFSQSDDESMTDLLNIYKETFYDKATEINAKYEKTIVMRNLNNIQKKIENYVKANDENKNAMEDNNLCINDLKLQIQEKEAEQLELIHKWNENCEKIWTGFTEIDNFYEKNKDMFQLEYKKLKNELLQASATIRNQLWHKHLDQIINAFVTNLERHYILDNET